MSLIFGSMLTKIRQISKLRHNKTVMVIKIAQFSDDHLNSTSEELIKKILSSKFPNATTIKVEDTSGGCGAMYDILVESKDFNGMSIVKQHRSVYDALNEQIKQIHGLHVVTKVPP